MVEFWPPDLGVEITQVNGGPGAVITTEGQPFPVFAVDVDPDDHRLREIDAVLNPDRFTTLLR